MVAGFALARADRDVLLLLQGIAFNNARQYRNYPLVSVELNSFMWAAVDAQTCLRRGWCTPVGGYSVYSSPVAKGDFAKKDSVILAAAINGRSFFHDIGINVQNDLSGLVGLLAVAEAFSRVSRRVGYARLAAY